MLISRLFLFLWPCTTVLLLRFDWHIEVFGAHTVEQRSRSLRETVPRRVLRRHRQDADLQNDSIPCVHSRLHCYSPCQNPDSLLRLLDQFSSLAPPFGTSQEPQYLLLSAGHHVRPRSLSCEARQSSDELTKLMNHTTREKGSSSQLQCTSQLFCRCILIAHNGPTQVVGRPAAVDLVTVAPRHAHLGKDA
jgi:hypothetical protein